MKRALILIVIYTVAFSLYSQYESPFEESSFLMEKRNCVTIGILNGGGSLVGFDFEFLVSDQIGLQVGAGYIGFGGGINYHLKPGIRSSFISLQNWNKGVGDAFAQNVLGPTFVFRGKKWLTFQLGLGATLETGPAIPDVMNNLRSCYCIP